MNSNLNNVRCMYTCRGEMKTSALRLHGPKCGGKQELEHWASKTAVWWFQSLGINEAAHLLLDINMLIKQQPEKQAVNCSSWCIYKYKLNKGLCVCCKCRSTHCLILHNLCGSDRKTLGNETKKCSPFVKTCYISNETAVIKHVLMCVQIKLWTRGESFYICTQTTVTSWLWFHLN